MNKPLAGRVRVLADTWHSKAWTGEITPELSAIAAELERLAGEMRMPPLGRGVMELKEAWADQLAERKVPK